MNPQQISYSTYKDKILGIWIGKSVGGAIGGPIECHKLAMNYNVEDCWPKEILPNDDLDIQVVWLEAMLELGPEVTSKELADYWRDRCWYNFSEYGYFLYNAERGIPAPESGDFNNRFFRHSMGCPIRSEIWGAVCPGNPALAASFAWEDGSLDHSGVSVEAEQFLAAATASSFFCNSIEGCIDAGLDVVPAGGEMSRLVADVRQASRKTRDWSRLQRWAVRKYGDLDPSKTKLNLAFTLLALCTCDGSFEKAVLDAVNCGWDTDCTAATAGALVGGIVGAKAIDPIWHERVGNTIACGIEVKNRNATFETLTELTARVGVEMAAVKNPNVTISDAPKLDIRRKETPRVVMSLGYGGGEPVLRASSGARVELTVQNNSAEPLSGSVSIAADAGQALGTLPSIKVDVPPMDKKSFPVSLAVESGADVLPDKNLLHAVLAGPSGQTSNGATLGLAGARQWMVYGPYFDIYDRTKYQECPFRNDSLVKNPAHVEGNLQAAFHGFLYLDRPYLDEQALAIADLPEEDPFVAEGKDDVIDASVFGHFHGEVCYYLVRTIVSPNGRNVALQMGSTGPFAVWLNGDCIYRHGESQNWLPILFEIPATLRSGENRLVIKFLKTSDSGMLSLSIMRKNPWEPKRGVSPYETDLSDKILRPAADQLMPV